MTLTRLPDPQPEQWLPDYTQIMRSADWYGFEHFGWAYGNFWADAPCRVRRHRWLDLGQPKQEPHPRFVYRCQRCGSQIHVRGVRPPARGTW